jgi:hypothetical protein
MRLIGVNMGEHAVGSLTPAAVARHSIAGVEMQMLSRG